jgi:carboxylesterase type B
VDKSAGFLAAKQARLLRSKDEEVLPADDGLGALEKHTAEIKYVFCNMHPSDCYDNIDMSLSTCMQDAWIAFAQIGVPHGMHGEP